MLIEIKGDNGIYDYWNGYRSKIDKSYFINLDLIVEINFNKYTETKTHSFNVEAVGEKNAIFLRCIGDGSGGYHLIFEEKGRGEYNRLKRLIEKNIIK